MLATVYVEIEFFDRQKRRRALCAGSTLVRHSTPWPLDRGAGTDLLELPRRSVQLEESPYSEKTPTQVNGPHRWRTPNGVWLWG